MSSFVKIYIILLTLFSADRVPLGQTLDAIISVFGLSVTPVLWLNGTVGDDTVR